MSLMLFDLMKMRYDDKTVFYVQTISGIRNTAAHRSAYQNKLNYVTYFLFLSMMSSSVCQSSEEFKNLHTTMAAISICVLSTSFFVFVWADIWAWLVTVRTGWLRLLPGGGWEPGLHIFSDCWRSSVMARHGHMDMGDTMLSWYHNMSGARDTSGFRCDKPESLFVLESIKLMEVRYLTLETLYPARDSQSLMAPGLWLVQSDHVTWILASDWLGVITWPG